MTYPEEIAAILVQEHVKVYTNAEISVIVRLYAKYKVDLKLAELATPYRSIKDVPDGSTGFLVKDGFFVVPITDRFHPNEVTVFAKNAIPPKNHYYGLYLYNCQGIVDHKKRVTFKNCSCTTNSFSFHAFDSIIVAMNAGSCYTTNSLIITNAIDMLLNDNSTVIELGDPKSASIAPNSEFAGLFKGQSGLKFKRIENDPKNRRLIVRQIS